ncbi:hypothetical protein E4U10_005620 [Claviceps purpurea]|nr:hypothetical protein E4U10_005620 [Claviceps purpurea]
MPESTSPNYKFANSTRRKAKAQNPLQFQETPSMTTDKCCEVHDWVRTIYGQNPTLESFARIMTSLPYRIVLLETRRNSGCTKRRGRSKLEYESTLKRILFIDSSCQGL